VRSVERKKIGRRQRIFQGHATEPNQCWSADFVSDKLTDGRSVSPFSHVSTLGSTTTCPLIWSPEATWRSAHRSLHQRLG
jgi:hypothetical protein